MHNLNYRERLEKLELPKLKYRRYGGDMIEVFKFSHDFYETNKLPDFEKAPPHNIRRHPFKIIKQNCKKRR